MRRSLRIALATGAGAAGLGLLLAVPAASAVDVWGNVAPASQLPGGALMDAYPLGHYQLDHHFSAVEAGVLSGVDVSGVAPTVAWLLASALWQLTALLATAVISLFVFAFSLDLVNGSAATGGAGALAPIGEAVRTIYRDVFGGPWLTVAVVLAGGWSMWNALVRRRYTETAGALAVSLACIVVALAFVTQPERTVGALSRWTNDVAASFLSITSNGSVGDREAAKGDAADHLFELLVYRPWVVLQFGGLEHCAEDGEEVRVRPLARDPGRDLQLARRLAASAQVDAENKTCVNHRIKYAPHFLRFAPESDERKAQYEALRDGDADKVPDADPGKGSYELADVDKPAAEAMDKTGQYQRLGLAVVIFAGNLGAFLLLGRTAVAVVLAQVLALLLLAFSPVALVVGTFPRWGHRFFANWLRRLIALLVQKAVYALILAVLLAVSVALQNATANLGWLMAWGLQAVYFWIVFLTRHQLVGGLTNAITGTSGQRDEARLLAGAAAAFALGRVTRRSIRHPRGPRPGAAPRPDRSPAPEPPPLDPADPQQHQPDAPDPYDRGRGTDRDESHDPEPGHGPARECTHGGSGDPGPIERGRRSDAAPPSPEKLPAEPAEPAAAGDSAAPPRASTPPRDRERPPVGGKIPPVDGAAAGRGATEPPPPAPARRVPAEGQPASRPVAAGGDGQPTGRPREPRSPLHDSLRADAARLHRDAQLVHRDADRHHREQPETPPTSAPRPRRPTGGERA